jgi:uncharacterized protein (DUF885 family)
MGSAIFDLSGEYVTAFAALHPLWATFRGVVVPGADPGVATDFSPDAAGARAELARATLAKLAALPPSTVDDQVAAVLLRDRLSCDVALYDAGEELRMLASPFGVLSLVRGGVELVRHTDADGWEALARRMASVPAMLASWRDALGAGLDRGLPAARRQAVEAAGEADRYAGLAGVSPTYATLVAAAPDDLRPRLLGAAEAAHGAFAQVARWLREDYAPRAVDVDGVGPERYALYVREELGADLDPVESYEWGWAELHRIEDEIDAELARVRPGASAAETVAALNETESVDGQDAYRAWLRDRHEEAFEALEGRYFDIAAPLRTIDVTLAVESSAGAAYYTPPSEDFSRPGRTWWPVNDRTRFAVWSELTTVFHEGVPGHHLQLGQTRLVGSALSRFSRLSGVSGHSEGWALYAERLADELGWFSGPGQRLGMLQGSALRAARVVVDIGIHLDLPLPEPEARRHGPKWTFEVAAEVLRERGRIAAHRLHPEVVRYCGHPAQATAYKLGERVWLAARAEAGARPGFDLKQWHTRALNLGPLPLANLAASLTA